MTDTLHLEIITAGGAVVDTQAAQVTLPLADGEKRWRMGGTSCLAGDYCGDWAFDRELKVGERVVFEDMIHYTMVKTTMFNGVHHPAIVIARRDGRTDVIREFGYEDFRNRMS